jgi:cell division protein FtsB
MVKKRGDVVENNGNISIPGPQFMKLPFGRVAFLVTFLAVASFAFVTLRGPRGIPALLEINRQIGAKEVTNGVLAQEVEKLRVYRDQLDNDRGVQEMEIRKRLKLMKKGEKVYIAPEPKH